jgi:hypothetical protein
MLKICPLVIMRDYISTCNFSESPLYDNLGERLIDIPNFGMMRQDFPPKQYFDSILATVQLFQAGF